MSYYDFDEELGKCRNCGTSFLSNFDVCVSNDRCLCKDCLQEELEYEKDDIIKEIDLIQMSNVSDDDFHDRRRKYIYKIVEFAEKLEI